MSTDWAEWHDAYAAPDSGLAGRLSTVRTQIERRLDAASPGPVRVVSACAGGRDLLGVLAERADASRVTALLVERDAALAARARDAARTIPARVVVRRGDAAQSNAYLRAVPAEPPPLVPGCHWFTFLR